MTVYDRLAEEMEKLGCRFGILKIDRILELKKELEYRALEEQLDPAFYKHNLERLESKPPPAMVDAQSVIIIAAPLPLTRLRFEYQGVFKPAQIPPFYIFSKQMAAIKKALGRSLGAAGYRIADARIPYKLAAVRCGLASYGRNNLAYVRGMGSFLRLVAFYSDLPAPADPWVRLNEMPECTGCGFCLGNCHTYCLDPDPNARFLARAERCLTLYNEEPGPLPEWINPWLHNSLIGCMRCQSSCPLNRTYITDVPTADTFCESETNAILSTPSFDDLPEALREKLDRYDLGSYYELIPRNLKFMVEWEL